MFPVSPKTSISRDQLACTHFSKCNTGDQISRDTNLSEKFLKNICKQEKSCSLLKKSFSVLLLLISTLYLKLQLLLLIGFVYVLCNKSASHWKHKLSAVCAPKDLLPPIYIYLLDPLKLSEWVSVFSIEVVSSFSASSVSIFGILSPPGDLGIGLV